MTAIMDLTRNVLTRAYRCSANKKYDASTMSINIKVMCTAVSSVASPMELMIFLTPKGILSNFF